MQVSVQTLINILEQLAPKRIAYEGDNVGLQVGNLHGSVSKIYVSLDITEEVLTKAKELGADFVVTHHPFIYKPLTAIRTDQSIGKLVQEALISGIGIYVAHTNLDLANGGVNDALADRLGLIDTKILRQLGSTELEKIVVYVPQGHVDNVHRAVAAAGAGWIGKYSHCSFQVLGTGTFMPEAGTAPYIGEQGKLEKAAEVRLETIVPTTLRNRVVRAILRVHPYEEVAYDLYPLLNEGEAYGLGRIGTLEHTCSLVEFCAFVKERLHVPFVRAVGEPSRLIKKVAVCGGAGSELINVASFAGADVLVTGDLRFHEAQQANTVSIAVIDAGHDATERVIVPVLCDYLHKQLQTLGYDIDVIASNIETSPWRAF